MAITQIGRNDRGLTVESYNSNGTIENYNISASTVSISALSELPGITNVQTAIEALLAERVRSVTDRFLATDGQTDFTLTRSPLGMAEILVNGHVQVFGDDYIIKQSENPESPPTVVWVSSDFLIKTGDKVVIFYITLGV